MATRTINEFRASFKGETARPARFDVQIPIPLKLVAYLNIARRLSFRCENAELPSVTLATTERKIYGPTEKHPYLKTYNQSTFNFIVSDDMSEKKFFDAWIELIIPKTTHDINYKSDYVVPITVNQYDLQNRVSYSVNLIDAFPISINQLDLDWSNESSHHKLAVTFAYHTWETNTITDAVMDIVNAGVSVGVDMATNVLSSLAEGKGVNFSSGGNSSSWNMKSVASGIDTTNN